MSELLKRAFDKAVEELPEDQQDEIGRWLLELMEADEERWDAAFARSPETLEQLGNEASKEFRAGKTAILNPDKL